MARRDNDPPSEAYRMANLINGIIQAAKGVRSGMEIRSTVRCRHHDDKPPCAGFIVILRQDLPDAIHWRCPRCDDSGTISSLKEKMGQMHIHSTPFHPAAAPNSNQDALIHPKAQIDRWLGPIVPAWSAAPRETIEAFTRAEILDDGPTVINEDLSLDELSGSTVLKHARLFLAELSLEKVKLTAKGNLNRKFVNRMCDAFEWPGYEAERLRKYNRTINEHDHLPLNIIHIIVSMSGLARKYRGHLVITKHGKTLLQDDRAGELQAVLFKTTYDNFNLGYLDRVPLEGVFQPQIGLTVFLIGKVAKNWLSPDDLLRLTVLPVDEFFTSDYDHPLWAFEVRVLKTLRWFGLLEKEVLSEPDAYPEKYQIRKSKLFEQFLSFNFNSFRTGW